jgi:hypothetical protein
LLRITLAFLLLCLCPKFVFAEDVDERGNPILRCDTVDQCLAYVTKSDCEKDGPFCDGGGIDVSKGYFTLPMEFQKFGRNAVPKLLVLLSSEDSSVRAKAAYLLSESHYLHPADLPPILNAWNSGESWIDDAVAKLGGREIVEDAFRELTNQPDYRGKVRAVDEKYDLEERPKQLLGAFARHKPELLRPAMACWRGANCDGVLFERLSGLLMEDARFKKPTVILFADIYSEILMQPAKQPAKRPFLLAALEAGRYMGEPTPALRDQVSVFVNSQDMELRSASIELLSIWKDLRSVAGQLAYIKSQTGFRRAFALRRFAEMGTVAQDAGQEIATYLSDSDWDTRAEAAYVLGKIDARDQVPLLVSLLSDSDWLLSYRIAEALASLDPQDKSGKRKELSLSYWHPAIRDIAARSLSGNIKRNDNKLEWMGTPASQYCRSLAPVVLAVNAGARLDVEEQNKRILAAQNEYERRLDAVTEFASAELVTNQKTIGGVVFQGKSMGEFGGSLNVTAGGKTAEIFGDNIDAVIQTSRGLYAVSSLGHMVIDYGYLLEVKRSDDIWTARRIFRLPGFIYQVFQSGDRLMMVGSTESIWLDESMKPHWIACGPTAY